VTPQSATLTQSGRAPQRAADIDGLTRQALGWSLPVAGLRDWLQGYAARCRRQALRRLAGQQQRVHQDGWRLRFAEWQDGPKGSSGAIPRIISAERAATATSDELAIKIVVDPVQ
jgi:outer membrane lipoprotein LolB